MFRDVPKMSIELCPCINQDALFHVMHLSTDHLCRVGLSFDDTAAAGEFFAKVQSLTADPENIALSGPPGKSR